MIELLFGGDHDDLVESGWGKTLSARQFVTEQPLDPGLWREPITGALMLRPAPMGAAWRESDAYEDEKMVAFAFHRQAAFWETIYTKPDSADPFLSTVYPAGLSASEIALETSFDVSDLATPDGEDIVVALQSVENLIANQGLYLECRHFGFDFEKASNYLILAFGQYGLRLQTDGIAALFKQTEDGWTALQEMRFCGQSEQHGHSMSLLILPVLGNRLHFYFSTGRAVNAAYDSQRTPGPHDSYHAYRLPADMEVFDSDAGIWRVIDEGPLRVVVSPGRRYFLQLARVTFPAGSLVALTGHDDIVYPRTEAPSVKLHGYLPDDAVVSATVLDHNTGITFLPGTDIKPQPSVTLTRSGNAVWSPEVHAVTLDFPALVESVDGDTEDLSGDVVRLRVSLSARLDREELEADVRGTVSADPGALCSLSLSGQLVFQGELTAATEHQGVWRLRIADGWRRLESMHIGSEISFDGMLHTDVVQRVLERAGFTTIEIANDDAPLPVSLSANDWRFAPKPSDSPADVLRMICDQFSGWTLRHDAGTWRYGPRATATTKYVYLSTSSYAASGHAASDKIRAFDVRFRSVPAEFTMVSVVGADASAAEVRRVMAVERSEGPLAEEQRGVGWTPTPEACARVARLMMRDGGHSARFADFDGEWKTGFLPGVVLEIEGEGVFRVEDVEILVDHDAEHLYRARYVAREI